VVRDEEPERGSGEVMSRRFRYEQPDRTAARTSAVGVRGPADDAALGSARDYWTGIVIGYLAAVLTSVALMLAFMKHGW
jgi:hypothetical protein